MATLSELVEVVAAVEGVDVERVGAIARAVREAGLIATHGRGPSAAQMMERDAANLLIAVNVAETARSAPETVTRYRNLLARRKKRSTEFGFELEKLIFAAKNDSIPEYALDIVREFGFANEPLGKRKYPQNQYEIKIEFNKPEELAAITFTVRSGLPKTMAIVWFEVPNRKPGITSNGIRGDRVERIAISHRTILSIGEIIRA